MFMYIIYIYQLTITMTMILILIQFEFCPLFGCAIHWYILIPLLLDMTQELEHRS